MTIIGFMRNFYVVCRIISILAGQVLQLHQCHAGHVLLWIECVSKTLARFRTHFCTYSLCKKPILFYFTFAFAFIYDNSCTNVWFYLLFSFILAASMLLIWIIKIKFISPGWNFTCRQLTGVSTLVKLGCSKGLTNWFMSKLWTA